MGHFGATRGLRQGDPLSSFLFTLVADELGRLMDKAMERVVKGFKVGRDEVFVSHLQFVDDTLLLLEAELDNIKYVNCLLKFFTVCSGLKINMGNNTLAGINMEENLLYGLALELGCEVGKWPLKYLGLPFGGNPVSLEFWSPVVEKSLQAAGWLVEGFSLKGRESDFNTIRSC